MYYWLKDRGRLSVPKLLFHTIRPHQWVKNILLLAPLLAAHQLIALVSLAEAAGAFLVFSLCASAKYVLNDMVEGYLSRSTGLLLSLSLMGVAVLASLWFPITFQLALAIYFLLGVEYNLHRKRFILLDTFVVATLYVIRIVAGAAAVGAPLSFWMLLFAIFLFLSLTLLKQCAELGSLRGKEQLRPAGRGYAMEDLPILRSMGTGAGYASVLILALYINSPEIEVLYRRPKWIWALCILVLYWISRLWMLAERGQMTDDPIAFALTDRETLVIGALAAAVVILAI